jgi:hypothetical protein
MAMSEGVVTIVWSGATDETFTAVQRSARSEGATLLATTIEALPACVALALERGGVVAITTGGTDSTYAFRLGVDDVLTVDQIRAGVVEGAVRSARARAQSRLVHRVRSPVVLGDVTQGLTLLTAALDQQLSPPLLAASDACLALRAEFDRLALTVNRLEEWAALVAPTGVLETIAQLRAQANPGAVHRKLHEVHTSLVRAEALIGLLRDVSTNEGRGGVAVSVVVAQLRELLLPHVSTWATMRAIIEGECVARLPRPAFVCMMSALIARSVSAIRSSGRVPGEIEIHVSEKSERESTVLVEIFDTGDPELAFGPEVRPGLVDVQTPNTLLSSIRERARQFGGELLVQSDLGGTTVRLLLPTTDAITTNDPLSDAQPRAQATSEPPSYR